MKAGTKANSKHKNMASIKKEDKYFWLIASAFLVLSFILSLVDSTDNKLVFYGVLTLRNLLFAGTVVGYSFFCNKPQRLHGIGSVIAISSIIGFVAIQFVSSKAKLNVIFCLLFANLVYSLVKLIRNGEKSKVTFGLSAYFGLVYMMSSIAFGLADDNIWFYIVVGILTTIVVACTIYLFINNKTLKEI